MMESDYIAKTIEDNYLWKKKKGTGLDITCCHKMRKEKKI